MVGNIGLLASHLSHLTKSHRPQKDILPDYLTMPWLNIQTILLLAFNSSGAHEFPSVSGLLEAQGLGKQLHILKFKPEPPFYLNKHWMSELTKLSSLSLALAATICPSQAMSSSTLEVAAARTAARSRGSSIWVGQQLYQHLDGAIVVLAILIPPWLLRVQVELVVKFKLMESLSCCCSSIIKSSPCQKRKPWI